MSMSDVDTLRNAGDLYRERRHALDEAMISLRFAIQGVGAKLIQTGMLTESEVTRITGLSRPTIRKALGKN